MHSSARGLKDLAWLFSSWLVCACSESTPSDPFLEHDAGGEAGAGGAEPDPTTTGVPDAGAPLDPELGGPCLDDAQCGDDIPCTLDSCDLTLERCRHVPDHGLCEDDLYCNGEERCEPRIGCVNGEPVACSDDRTCTIDRCVERTRSCEHTARDADGDGDGVWNCGEGGDCNDQNPRVSSLREEICGNGVDDDCDSLLDEEDCAAPEHDRCDEALVVDESGSYELSFAAAGLDYGLSCSSESEQLLDLVVDIVVPDGAAQDVDVLVSSSTLNLALALRSACDDASSEQACQVGMELEQGSVARLRAFSLEPGRHSLLVFGDAEGLASLRVDYAVASAPPANETCGSAGELAPGRVEALLPYAAAVDHQSACEPGVGDLVYRFELQETADVHVYSNSLDDFGEPVISLRDAACAPRESELSCRAHGAQAHLFARALEPGVYHLLASASAPAAINLLLELDAPSVAPSTDACETAPSIQGGESVTLALREHTELIEAGCLVGAVDAAYALSISEPTDLLLLQSFAATDETAIALAEPGCAPQDLLACDSSSESPLRVRASALAPGEYRVITESAQGNSVRAAVLTRPATEPALVVFSDTCSEALEIPGHGGRFYGNTATTSADYAASCDFALSGALGASEQMLRLVLTEPRRVILDMRGSEYDTLLVVREGPECPGEEVSFGCAPDIGLGPSYLDLELAAGEYFVQVDGYAGEAGPWQLDVFTAPL